MAQLAHAKSDAVSVDLILKAHDPPKSNAARFLQKMAESKLGDIPTIGKSAACKISCHCIPPLARLNITSHTASLSPAVYSSKGNQDTVAQCLSLGASDYWIKPLRSNEIRNLWTRVWWRRAGTEGFPEGMDPRPGSLGESSGDGSDSTRK